MKPSSMEHVVVYRNDDEFAGWPANGGFWQFADGELVVGFFRGPCDYQSDKCTWHQYVDVEHVTLRSSDGGRTWGDLCFGFNRLEVDARLKDAPSASHTDHGFDPTADGWCLVAGFGIPPTPNVIFAQVSTDRGRTWHEPARLPTGRFEHLGGRPNYVVRPDGVVLLCAHASRGEGEEGGAKPLIYASHNGGASWGIIGEVDLTPAKPGGIMPYPIICADGTYLFATRRQYDGFSAYTQVYASQDDGKSWSFRSRVNDWGAPASLTELPDGRIVCVYGYRQKDWGIRARVSEDQARTWGSEIILRADGGSWDLGYPRTLLRPDGKLVTVYYFNSQDDPKQHYGGVRHIAATIWEL